MKARTKAEKIFIIFFITGLMVFHSACSSAGTTCENENREITTARQGRVEGEYLVKLRNSVAKSNIKKYFSDYSVIEIKLLGKNLYKLKIKNDPGPEKLQEIAETTDIFDYIEPNYIYRINPPARKEKLKRVKE